MRELFALIKRNVKLFFKDKGMFFTSLITPLILLVLYSTFLGEVYRDAFTSSLPSDVEIPKKLINGIVGGQLISSILAVSCVTVAFCSNFLMVQDKVNNSIKDLKMSPVSSSTLSLGYYLATFVSTFIICFVALILCLIYLAVIGWYLTILDVLCLIFDIILLILFGTALSSIISYFLTSQGQISAVGTIVSAGYGFICGAYMPISSFSSILQKVMLFLPGTYGTSLFRNHSLNSALSKLNNYGVNSSTIEEIKSSIDCNLKFFGSNVNILTMYIILGATTALLIGIYILINASKKSKKH